MVNMKAMTMKKYKALWEKSSCKLFNMMSKNNECCATCKVATRKKGNDNSQTHTSKIKNKQNLMKRHAKFKTEHIHF